MVIGSAIVRHRREVSGVKPRRETRWVPEIIRSRPGRPARVVHHLRRDEPSGKEDEGGHENGIVQMAEDRNEVRDDVERKREMADGER